MFKNLFLLLVSCVIGLLLCEVSLRLFYPRYRDLAEAQFERDALRVWVHKPNSRNSYLHPDTRLSHSWFHNNLGLRQHRDFGEADLGVATNVGFFGDSFTENARMAAQYSFTEPLDYLLNLQRDRSNVLNFGTDGYGPDQSFLHYEYSVAREDLDHVLYIYCHNDLWDIYVRGLFHLDDAGRLAQVEAFRSAWWVPLVSRFHVTYLVLDAIGRVSFMVDRAESAIETNEHLIRGYSDRMADLTHPALHGFPGRELAPDALQINLEIFRQLIRRWKNLVEDDGGTFSIVLLPAPPPQSFLVDLIRAEDIDVIDLYACFNNVDPTHAQTPWPESSYSFENDGHWNEAGNSLAAVCLYRALEDKMGFSGLSEDELQEAVHRYYTAFGGEEFLAFGHPRGEGGDSSAPLREASVAEIRKKYMELDLRNDELLRQLDKRIISSDFDVYLARDHLVYVKDNCRPTDMEAPFFLHVTPVDDRDLPVLRRQHGFDNISVYRGSTRSNDRQCAFMADLPDYPIRRINTGQYLPGARRLWDEEFAVVASNQSASTE